jgi:hypothetical protein
MEQIMGCIEYTEEHMKGSSFKHFGQDFILNRKKGNALKFNNSGHLGSLGKETNNTTP